jgi:hypothetical protein
MRFSLLTLKTILIITHVLIPLVLVYLTLTRKNSGGLGWSMEILTFSLYFVFIYLAGTWSLVSFHLRYAFPGLFFITVIISFLKAKDSPFWVDNGVWGWMGNIAGLIISLALIYLIVGAIRSYYYEEMPLNLAFPFKKGSYAVFEGGNGKASPLMNYHYGGAVHKGAGVNRSMKYAVDITKLSIWGNDANGFLPRENEKYPVFNEVAYSPCNGRVFDIIDQWPNEIPGGNKAPYNVGNHIVIQSGNFLVLMGHLQKGSFKVKVGDQVHKGQPVAKAGNSGWTIQPHLHMQAMKTAPGSFWSAEGIPIFLEGKNPVKNTLFFKSS